MGVIDITILSTAWRQRYNDTIHSRQRYNDAC
jgi:hypothetical protein